MDCFHGEELVDRSFLRLQISHVSRTSSPCVRECQQNRTKARGAFQTDFAKQGRSSLALFDIAAPTQLSLAHFGSTTASSSIPSRDLVSDQDNARPVNSRSPAGNTTFEHAERGRNLQVERSWRLALSSLQAPPISPWSRKILSLGRSTTSLSSKDRTPARRLVTRTL